LTQFGTSCSFSLVPPSTNTSAAGGTGNVQVVASGPACSWSSTQVSSWISLVGAGSGKGSGAVTLNIAPNLSASTQTGSITIAGQPFTVTQAGVGCTYSLSSPGTSVASTGGLASFNVTVPSGCTWNV